MTIQCPSCKAKYRLTKIPPRKVLATCKKCGEKFLVLPTQVPEKGDQDSVRPSMKEKTPSAETKAEQQTKAASSKGEKTNWYDRKGLAWLSLFFLSPTELYRQWKSNTGSTRPKRALTVVLILFVTAIVGVYMLRMDFDFASGKKWERQAITIDYFSTPSPKSVMVHQNKYALIDHYTKWIPILYYHRHFDAVEAQVSNLLAKNDEKSAYELHTLYGTLAKIRDGKNIPQMDTVLNDWCNKHPESHIPWLVRGNFLIDWAWHIRGSAYAKTVKEDAWPRFYDKLKQAKDDLERAWRINAADPNSCSSLITVAMGLGASREAMEQYFQKGLSACPWHFPLHFAKLEYLKAKWHGSEKEMLEFAQHCQALSDSYPHLGLVMAEALSEMHMFTRKGQNFLGKNEAWATVENIYDKFFAVYPDDVRRRLFYAYHAYEAEKYPIAYKQFEIIGDRWMPDTPWSSLDYYNQSRAITIAKIGEEICYKKKLYEASLDYFEKAVQIEPYDYTYYQLAMAYMNTGSILRDRGYLETAVEHFETAIQFNGANRTLARKQLKKVRNFLRS
jgi:predicted Zn finger-like uncharacterized protein